MANRRQRRASQAKEKARESPTTDQEVTPAEVADPRSVPEVAVDWARGNVLWMLGLAPLVLAALQVLIVARGDLGTLRILIQNADPVQVILGTVLPVVPFALAGLGPYYIERRIRRERIPGWWFGASIAITLLGLFTLPADWFAGLSLMYASMVFVAFEWYLRRKGKVSVRVYDPVLWMLIVTVVMAGLAGPWFSAEVIEQRNDGPIVAYVVGEEGDWTTLMLHGSGIKIVPSDDVLSRTVCNVRIRGRTAAARFMNWPESNPKCDEVVSSIKSRTGPWAGDLFGNAGNAEA